MTRYFFDFREGKSFLEDEVGLEFPNLEVAGTEAAVALAEYARDVVAESNQREFAIEVRAAGKVLLVTRMTFEATSPRT